MKKKIINIFVVGIIVVICLLIKILFFNKNIPTGDQNGEVLTNYSSKDMLGNWNINIIKQYDNLIDESLGTMNISSFAGSYFYGTITINEAKIKNKSITGGTVNVEGSMFNDIVTIYFNFNEEYLNINYDAKFTPKILNNHIILNLNDIVKEGNKSYKYILNLTKKEVNNDEK